MFQYKLYRHIRKNKKLKKLLEYHSYPKISYSFNCQTTTFIRVKILISMNKIIREMKIKRARTRKNHIISKKRMLGFQTNRSLPVLKNKNPINPTNWHIYCIIKVLGRVCMRLNHQIDDTFLQSPFNAFFYRQSTSIEKL